MSNQKVRFPSEEEKELAAFSSGILSKHINQDEITVKIEEDGSESIVLPRQAILFLVDILDAMSQGNTVTLMPVHKELTTSEAASILNVSRPYLIKLLESGDIKHHKIGTHRRIKFEDLMEYKHRRDSEADSAADELAAIAQELELDM